MTRRILITTGNGMFGHHLIEQLLGRDDIEIRAMVRDTSKFTLTAPNLEVVTGDMDDPASLQAPTKDVTHIFLTSPMDDRITARETAVIDAAKANGSPRVMYLYGAVAHKGDPLDQQHLASIEHLKASGLPWTTISPNSVMETSLDSLADQVPMGQFMGMSGHGKVGLIAVVDVARFAAVVATTDGHEGQNHRLTGPEAIDMSHVAATFSQVLDRHIVYLDLPEDEFAQMLMDHAGFTDRAALDTQVLCHLRAWRDGGADVVTGTVEQLTGQPAMTLDAWVEANREEFDRKPKMSERIAGFMLKGKYGKDKLPES